MDAWTEMRSSRTSSRLRSTAYARFDAHRTMAASIRRALAAGGAIASFGIISPGADAAGTEYEGTKELDDKQIKVTVTGSNIPQIERESGLPLRIITREQIERAHIQTAAELVNTISAATSYGSYTENQAFAGSSQPGLAGAGLRGLTIQRTLVLLNGRRIANFALTASAVDLNAIPLAAIERVEILKDGASAIYGTDAIGGVINFVMRQEFAGVDAFAQYSSPQHTG